MRRALKPLALGGLLLAFSLAARFGIPARADEPGQISLMQTLSAWKYPGAQMPDGASMSDGGNPRLQSVKCAAVLTTPDPIDKVIAFHAEKLGAGEAKSVAIQDDSKGRPVALRVFLVNKADTSTTLAISRAEGEKETHIAWSHYIRIGGER
jgi:hypothetical protein